MRFSMSKILSQPIKPRVRGVGVPDIDTVAVYSCVTKEFIKELTPLLASIVNLNKKLFTGRRQFLETRNSRLLDIHFKYVLSSNVFQKFKD